MSEPSTDKAEEPRPEEPKPEELKPEDLFPPHILPQYDPEAVEIIMMAANLNPLILTFYDVPIEVRRADPEKYRPPHAKDTTGMDGVRDFEVTSEDGYAVPIRVYTPVVEETGEVGRRGVHLNFHGGGFVFGDLTNEGSLCLSMRDGAGVVVVDVNYRHSPEAEWHKALEDAWAALEWVRSNADLLNIDPSSVSVGGISAGGHISLVLQHRARDAGIPLKLCMASVPGATEALTYDSASDSPFASFQEFADGPILPWKAIHYFGRYCFPRERKQELIAKLPEWWVDPLKSKNWTGLCETFIRTGECDPLRDEAEAYARKLVAGGCEVRMKRYLGCPHTFMFWSTFSKKKIYDEDSIAALKRAHGT